MYILKDDSLGSTIPRQYQIAFITYVCIYLLITINGSQLVGDYL